MARSCTWKPKIKNINGELRESQLFPQLTKYADNRQAAIDLWDYTRVHRNSLPDDIALDGNGEITLESLISHYDVSQWISETQLQEKLNREVGHFKKGSREKALVQNTAANRRELAQKAVSFNEKSPFRSEYLATVSKDNPNELLSIEVQKRTQETEIDAHKMAVNEALNKKLTELLNSWGVSVGVLTDLEERLGISGITDFEQAKEVANGLIELIRISKGQKGQKALPEEFAHATIRMLENNSFVKRLVNLINDQDLVKEILGDKYGQYYAKYNGNEALLAEEAAGKLLAKHLLQQETIPVKPYKTILQKVIAAVKEFFAKLSETDIQKAMREADKEFGELTKNILNHEYDEEIDPTEIRRENHLYHIANSEATNTKEVLEELIKIELKRLHIYRDSDNEFFSDKQQQFINDLESRLIEHQHLLGISKYLQTAIQNCQSLRVKLTNLNSDTSSTMKQKAQLLNNIKIYLTSYQQCIEIIEEAMATDELSGANEFTDEINESLDRLNGMVSSLYSKYRNLGFTLFADFLRPIFGDGIEIPLGKAKGKKITVEDVLKRADKDISFFERWLDSASNSSDYFIKAIDQMVKKAKGLARLDTLADTKLLMQAGIELEQAGIHDTEWMFERDAEGHLTDYYISKYDWVKFKSAKNAFARAMDAKYNAKTLSSKEEQERKKDWAQWYKDNTDYEGNPLLTLYASSEYQSIQADPAKKKFYDTVMSIKEELDSYLPEGSTSLYNSIKIRKDFLERVKSGQSAGHIATEQVKDTFIKRGDDTLFGDKAIVKDFEGRAVQQLPIYYTKRKEGESPDDISTDVVSTMIAYAAMVNDYNRMNDIIDLLEIGRDVARQRQIQVQEGGEQLKETIHSLGRTISSTATKSTESSNFMDRLNDYFTMQVYGRYMADEGKVGKAEISKVANFVNQLTAMNTFALNLLAGISNVTTGTVMMRIESICGEYFSESQTLKADGIYSQEALSFIGEIGNRVQTSKLALWDELFNVLQDYESTTKDVRWNRRNWVSRMFSMDTTYFMNNLGEHWMQNRTSIALALNTKMLDENGKETNLWEAMERVWLDPQNHSKGATLKVKEGYTKEDGTAFTNDDIIAFSRKSAAINQRLHGIYNQIDQAAIQRLGLGRMAILYRKWMRPSWDRRFRQASYNMDLQNWEEGYYYTTGRFLMQVIKDLRKGEFAIATMWNEMTSTERANIIRAGTEVAHLILLAGLLSLFGASKDYKHNPWAMRMMEYQARRLYTELGAMVPGTTMLNEGLKILKSPAAGISTIEDIVGLAQLTIPSTWTTELQSGRYKGHTKAYKTIMQSPLLPYHTMVYKWFHPEEGIPYYKNSSY